MGLSRNRVFRRQFMGMALALALVTLGAWWVGDAISAGAAAAASAVALALFAVMSMQRYHEIAHLAAEVDRILHATTTGRTIDFSDYHEGDVAILRNELAKMTSVLRDANRRIEQEKTALSDALADVSHQIRTPLTAMNLMLPLIEKASDTRERTHLLHDLENLIDRVGWLVTALLKLAKVDAGAIRVQAVPVQVSQVVHDAVAPLEISFDLHGVACVVEADPHARFIGDATWTTEALENIVKNCLEHTPVDGTVRIAATEDALATRIVVTDTGPGIAPEDLSRIFERFYRGRSDGKPLARADDGKADAAKADDASDSAKADSPEAPSTKPYSNARSPQGFGVGLPLAQSLVCAQGGTLHAENASEGGARFVMVFPKITV